MRWEQLTVPDFTKAVQTAQGFGIIPIGVLEPHATHLPLGQDMLASHMIACRAAEIEPAIVFPGYPFGILHGAGHMAGAVVLKRDLVLALLQNVCDEMARNGIKKILLLSGHGGNDAMLHLFVQTFIEEERPYIVYTMHLPTAAPPGVLETTEIGHACEHETSVSLALFPEWVKMEDVPKRPFMDLKRGEPMKGRKIYSPVDWYARYPTAHVGDPSKGTAEKGKKIVEASVQRLVEAIRMLKADRVSDALMREQFVPTRDPVKSKFGI